MSTPNPYAAPKAAVSDQAVAVAGDFTPGGRARPAAEGWTWIVEGWRFFMKSPGIWIAVTLVMLVISLVANLIPLVGPLAMMVLTPVFAGGLMLGCRALDEGRELELAHLFAGFRAGFGNLLVVGAVYLALMFAVVLVVGLISGVGMFALFGGHAAQNPAMAGGALATLALGVLVGLALTVPIAMVLWFAPALVALDQVAPLDALKQSWSGCLKNMVPFLVYGVVLFILAIVASIPLGLGWLVLGPLMVASIYTSYRDIYLG
jgi:uncharacterized membrane protein